MISKTFCSAPWFGVRLNWNGTYAPCCEIDLSKTQFKGQIEYNIHNTTVDQWMTSDYLQYLKQSLDQGLCVSECSKCWVKEKSGVQSLRQITNNTSTGNCGENLENTWIKSFLKNQNYKNYMVIMADVKLNNVCNFACAMCNPRDSSKIFDHWKNDQESYFVQQILQQEPKYFERIALNYQNQRGYQHLQDILKQPVKHLKLLGGEPLLDRQMLNMLLALDIQKKSSINLHFVTNGSQDILSIAQQLKDFLSVNFTVSLEGVGKVQDYVRQGSIWNQVEKNILQAVESGIRVDIGHTIQAMSVLGLHELINWSQKHNLKINHGLLHKPDYLSVSVLPQHLRQLALDRIQLPEVQNMIKKQNYAIDKYPIFQQYVDWYQEKNLVKLQDLFPELSA